VTYFVDRSLGRHDVVRALRSAGRDVIGHDDVFAADTPDLSWLETAATERWIVVSKDAQLRYPPERDLIVASGLHVFVVTNAQLSGPTNARLLVARAAAMERYVQHHDGGHVTGLYHDAPHLRRLYPVRSRRRRQRRQRG
jgi:hypothetical protein